MVQSGYDGACDYFNAKYNLWQMDPSGKLKDRMSGKDTEGHMMYLRKQDLETANDDIRVFIKNSLPKKRSCKVCCKIFHKRQIKLVFDLSFTKMRF
jgi:hypothetical protein